jgi:hypothetical protein
VGDYDDHSINQYYCSRLSGLGGLSSDVDA